MGKQTVSGAPWRAPERSGLGFDSREESGGIDTLPPNHFTPGGRLRGMTVPTLTPRQVSELERRLFGPARGPVLDRLFGWGARVFILRDRLAVVR